TTVTGAQYLLETDRARVLIDCGMFQGGPNEALRNRVPFAYDPSTIDAMVLTHAHLDHCGLIPHLVNEGYTGPVHATAATIELATLVLLDSGKLQEEFAKREDRWERRNPDKAAKEDVQERAAYEAAVELAERGEETPDPESGRESPREPVPSDAELARAVPPLAASPALSAPGTSDTAEHVTTSVAVTTPVAVATPVAVTRPVGFPAPAAVTTSGPAPDRDPEVALRAQPPEIQVDLDAPLYTADDARRSLVRFSPVRYDAEVEVAPGVHATFLDAGHILGSAIIRIRVADREGGPELTLVFSGDLGRPDTPILRDPTVLTDADYVLLETTYGGREHEPSEESIRILTETIRLVAEHDGVLLVPSFAIGRTQEIVWQLDRLIEAGEIPQLPLYLDSPMASKATDIYRRHPEDYDDETRKLLDSGDTPLDYPDQHITNDVEDSKAIARAPRPYMIVASNGMLTGGRVVAHLRNLIDDPGATLLFVGYQGEGTLGAHLQAGAKQVRIDGETRNVRCTIRSISGFSAHADEPELLAWVKRFADGKRGGEPGFPKRVFLVHGDPDAQQAIEPKVRALGFDTFVPVWRQVVELG
ncbi:MAG TPA: MBL fold metallo-hydrolase RNA specificity domain-containing protein, partial [Candidatus Dormibacteraeota bacterium]|nr:MBL fold metallo-hydrolase RNA specificity domain-containing protein [Candidatus Dormibacteraeota bacterium]